MFENPHTTRMITLYPSSSSEATVMLSVNKSSID